MHKNILFQLVNKSSIGPKMLLTFFMVLFLSFSSVLFSQAWEQKNPPEMETAPTPGTAFDDDVNDEAPIDSAIMLLLGLGAALGFYLINKRESRKIIKKSKY